MTLSLSRLPRGARQIAIIALLLALAWCRPQVGTWVSTHLSAKSLAVVVIFFLTGATLTLAEVTGAARNLRFHAAVQIVSFGVFPGVMLLAVGLGCPGLLDPSLRPGLLCLAVLPTTISSCVVFTSLAGGNAALATVNAVGGNILGVIVSPLLLSAALGGVSGIEAPNPLPLIARISLLVVAPFLAGHFAPRSWRGSLRSRRTVCRRLNRGAIMLLIYLAFCGTFQRDTGGTALGEIGVLLAFLALLHAVMLALSGAVFRLLQFRREERIAALFLGSQKTLAMGVPLITGVCAATPGLSPDHLLLPVVLYSPLQIAVASLLAGHLAHHRAQLETRTANSLSR